ncbi:MAG: zinc metallopeptidase [Mucilaginibacter polytrichastri]|nr:zinc metallopeptidase [Mucilaginibacter polytrichastri]
MKWFGRRESGNVDDQRGGGGGRGIALGGGGIIIVIIAILLGKDPSQLLAMLDQGGQATEQRDPAAPDPDSMKVKFVKVVLADTEDVWDSLFRVQGQTYQKPRLVLFTGEVQSACGGATAATGPFYCPGDSKVYIDLSFYDELKNRFKASGDFAEAYVIAHEVGHHIQNLLGTSEKVQRQRNRLSEKEYNKLSVKLELQADFYAGLWAHHDQKTKHILEEGDIEEALNAANAIGDDRLQEQMQGRVTPDSFTHGTSAQRMYWFKKGFETGDIRQGDTFSDRSLAQL